MRQSSGFEISITWKSFLKCWSAQSGQQWPCYPEGEFWQQLMPNGQEDGPCHLTGWPEKGKQVDY